MNKENIKKVIDHLRDDQMQMIVETDAYYSGSGSVYEFNMGDFAFACGTPSCIAGHAAHNAGIDIKTISPNMIFCEAKWFFGINTGTADKMFCPQGMYYNKITPGIAADMLEHFIETEEVVWPESVKIDD